MRFCNRFKEMCLGSGIVLILNVAAYAVTPVIVNVPTTPAHKQSVDIIGSGFGQKIPATPLRYLDFEDGVTGQEVPNNESGGGLYIDGSNQIVYDDTHQRFPGAQNLQQNFNNGKWGQIVGLIEEDTIASSKLYMHGYWRIETHGAVSRNAKFLNLGREYNPGTWQSRVDADNNPCNDSATMVMTMWPGCPAGDNHVVYINDNNQWQKILGNDGNWHRIESYIDLHAAYRNLYVDSELMGENSTTDMTDGCADASIGYVFFGYYYSLSDCTPAPSAERWWDEIYVDTTQARIEICDSAEWSTKSHCEIQIPTSWSATEITFTANQGSFANGSTVYLFVVDSDGNPNATGYEFQFGPQGSITYGSGTITHGSGSFQ